MQPMVITPEVYSSTPKFYASHAEHTPCLLKPFRSHPRCTQALPSTPLGYTSRTKHTPGRPIYKLYQAHPRFLLAHPRSTQAMLRSHQVYKTRATHTLGLHKVLNTLLVYTSHAQLTSDIHKPCSNTPQVYTSHAENTPLQYKPCQAHPRYIQAHLRSTQAMPSSHQVNANRAEHTHVLCNHTLCLYKNTPDLHKP